MDTENKQLKDRKIIHAAMFDLIEAKTQEDRNKLRAIITALEDVFKINYGYRIGHHWEG